jgi:predicted nucleic acid-binding protein
MKEHGIKTIFSHDRDFRRLSFLEVIDPLQELPG